MTINTRLPRILDKNLQTGAGSVTINTRLPRTSGNHRTRAMQLPLLNPSART